MSDFLTLNNKQYTYADICSAAYLSLPLDNYEKTTLEFCTAWLGGQQNFTVNTSGSSGTPKPIVLTREQMQTSARATGKALGLAKGQSAFICLNTSYIAGVMMLVRGFELELAMTIIPPTGNPWEHWANTSQNFPSFDFTALVPLQIQAVVAQPLGRQWLDAMHAVIVGGAPVNYALEQQLKTLNSAVYVTYGMTETVTHIALRRISGKEASQVYQLLPNAEIRQDKRGCLEVKSPVTLNQWITTNDLVELVQARAFKWLGRADRVINTGGVKVQIEKTERVLDQLLAEEGLVRRFFIAGLPDQRLGERVVVIIEGTTFDPTVQQELLAKAKTLLKKYEVPKNIHFVPVFKETPTAKTDRLYIIEQLSKNEKLTS